MKTTGAKATRRRWRWRGTVVGLGVGVGLVVVAAVLAWLGSRFRGAAASPADTHAAEAQAALAAGRVRDAASALERWLQADPKSGPAHALKAELILGEGNLGEVSKALYQARDLGCPPQQLDRVHALVLARMGRFAEAEPLLLRQRQETSEPDPAVDEALARIYLRTYRLPEAEAALQRWLLDAPTDARPYLWLTEIDRRADRAGVLEAHYHMALKLDPSLARARLGLAELLRKAHRLDEAAREYQAHIEREPDDAPALAGLGAVEAERNDLDAAAGHLDRALALAPDNVLALRERALIDLRRGNAESALERIEKGIAADPLDDDLLYNKVLALRRLGRLGEAEAAARSLDRLRKDQAEVAALREQVVARPDDDDARIAVARWMFGHGRDDEGIHWARNVLDRKPTHREAHRVLAEHYTRAGEAGLANYHRLLANTDAAKP